MRLKSGRPGSNILNVEVKNISAKGLRMVIDDEEYLLSYEDFPWFKDADLVEVLHVTQPHPGHLYWPDLDIDLAVESIKAPEKYPLVWNERAGRSR